MSCNVTTWRLCENVNLNFIVMAITKGPLELGKWKISNKRNDVFPKTVHETLLISGRLRK